MKKIKMFAAVAMFCTAAFSGYTAYDQATMTDQERFMLANIEALTEESENDLAVSAYKKEGTITIDDGNGGSITVPYIECGGKGTIVCP